MLRLWLLVVLACVGALAPSRACARTAETRAEVFLFELENARPNVAAQVAESHLANPLFGYDLTPGSCLAAESESGFVNLTDAEGQAHILDRHGPGRGMPGKSEFPSAWSDERVLHEASDIATDPAQTWSPPNSRGYVTTTKTVDGVDVKVVYDTVNNRIVTAYPTNVPRNP